jgi:hypothetical protein
LVCLVSVFCASSGRAAQTTRPAETFRYRIEFSTLLGGNEYDDLREIIPLPDNSLLLGGQTVSPDFPVTQGALQTRYGGEPAGTGHPGVYGGDCFLARLSADGREVLAATFFGGSKQERDVYGMALDRQGNIVVTTTTRSPDMPTTEGAFQRRYGGGEADVVVAKLSSDLKRLIWCTYIGGSGNETPRGGLAVDAADNIYVVGTTASADFPVTSGVVGAGAKGGHDAFIVKVKGDGSGLVWSTRLGGRSADGIMGVQVDAAGTVCVAGHTQSDDFPVTPGAPQAKLGGKSDCFLASLSADARTLRYSTFLGGQDDEFAEHRLALLADGSVLLTGVTSSRDFPTTEGVWQRSFKGKTSGFVTKLSPDGRRFVWSTLLGASDGEFLLMPTTDASGNIYVVGHSTSPDFPTTAGAVQAAYGGKGDGVFAILSADGSRLLYATYLGSHEEDLLRSLAIGPKGEVYLIGKTASDDFRVTAGAAQARRKGNSDAFVVKLVPVR